MTALIIVGVVVGYLLIGAIFARVMYRIGWIDEPHEPLLAVFGWAVFLPLAILGVAGWGLHKLITKPTRPERIQAKIERSQRRIDELERELDIR